jgi:hypothetical protein
MNMMRIITAAMVVAWIGCLAMSERPFDDALETDGAIGPTTRSDAVSLTDFDPLEARPAGVIRSKNYKPPVKKGPKLPPEGSKIVDRLCRIIPDPSGWVLVRFPADGERKAIRPRWALPNAPLEALEALQAKNPKMMFRVSGEMTLYRNNSFVLIRRVAIVDPPEEPEPEVSPQPLTSIKPIPASQPASKPATQPTSQPATAPSSADLMKALLAEKNPTPVILPRQKKKIDAAKVKSVAPGAKGDVIEPATARLIVDRLMTIRKTDRARWREATFEADNTLREPPVLLLPCRLLAYAEIQPPSKRLRVTGEVTKYKGKRYMLLRKVVIERVMNRL